MSTAARTVKLLSALVKTIRYTEDGKAIKEPTGMFTPEGKPILRTATRIVQVKKDEPLPESIAEGELERLDMLGALYPPEKTPAREPAKPAAKQAPKQPAKPAAGGADADALAKLELLGAMTDDELVEFLGSSGIGGRKIVDAVGDNPDLAARVIAAEKTATKGDGRGNLVGPLTKVAAAKGGEPS